MAATSRKLSSAATRPSRGTLISPSDMTVSRTLMVSSGTRLSSSRYSSPPSRMARTSGPSEKFSGRAAWRTQVVLRRSADYLLGQCGQSVLVNDDAADVLAGHQVVVALVDLF